MTKITESSKRRHKASTMNTSETKIDPIRQDEKNAQSNSVRDIKRTKLIFFVSISIYTAIWAGFLMATMETDAEDQSQIKSLTTLTESTQQTKSISTSPDDGKDTSMPEFEILEEEPIPLEKTVTDKPEAIQVITTVPPGDLPPGVSIENELEVTGCWDATGFPMSKDSCGKLAELENVVTQRLYVADQCRRQVAGNFALGQLDLGMELDFEGRTLSFWSKPSSRLPSSNKVTTCIDSGLKGLPLGELNPKFARYHVSMTLIFSPPGVKNTPTTKDTSSVGQVVTAADMDQGRIVSVIKDRVRIRKTPINGEILGKISSGSRVILLGESEGWCNVKTPRNEGWMVCWALAL